MSMTGKKHSDKTKAKLSATNKKAMKKWFWETQVMGNPAKFHMDVLSKFVRIHKHYVGLNEQACRRRAVLNRIKLLLKDYSGQLTDKRLLFLHGMVLPAVDNISHRIEWRHRETDEEIAEIEGKLLKMLGH